MKKLLLILSLGILFAHCNSNPIEKPKDLISKEVMVDILYDLYLTNTLNSSDSKYLLDRGITPAKYIYTKYKVDSLQFSRSDRYYAADVEDYEKLYKNVTLKLLKEKEIIDALIAKEVKLDMKNEEIKSKDFTPIELADSLSKKRLHRKKILKDSLRN